MALHPAQQPMPLRQPPQQYSSIHGDLHWALHLIHVCNLGLLSRMLPRLGRLSGLGAAEGCDLTSRALVLGLLGLGRNFGRGAAESCTRTSRELSALGLPCVSRELYTRGLPRVPRELSTRELSARGLPCLSRELSVRELAACGLPRLPVTTRGWDLIAA